MFTHTKTASSLVFRLYHQAKDHFKITMLKLQHRLKLSSFLLMQMSQEEAVVERVKKMNHFQLMSLHVSISEVLKSSEYCISL